MSSEDKYGRLKSALFVNFYLFLFLYQFRLEYKIEKFTKVASSEHARINDFSLGIQVTRRSEKISTNKNECKLFAEN